MFAHIHDQWAITKLLPEADHIKQSIERVDEFFFMHLSFKLPVSYLKEVNELIDVWQVTTVKKSWIMQKRIEVDVRMKTTKIDLVNDILTSLLSPEIRRSEKICSSKQM